MDNKYPWKETDRCQSSPDIILDSGASKAVEDIVAFHPSLERTPPIFL